MYYLLEFSKTAPKEIHETLDFGLKDEEIQRKYKNIIIKQSENVYDLIEIGDLVRIVDLDEKERIIEINDSLPVKTHLKIFEEFYQEVVEIYKKDFKGNYILVWNKECEEG